MRLHGAITHSGSLTLTTIPRHSVRAKVLYFLLRLLYPRVVSRFLGNPTESGHQHSKLPKSLHKSFDITKRDFYDWTVYDISPKSSPKSSTSSEKDEIKRRFMYIPGTGFTIPTSREHFKFVATALTFPNTVVTIVLHPLAPKHTASTVYPKFFELYSQLASALPPDGELDIGGDSSGGGISLSIVQHLAQHGLRLPNRLFMMSPSVDFAQPKESDMKEVSKLDPLQDVEESYVAHKKWANDEMELEDPRISPIRGDFSTIKDVRIIGLMGTYDILEPDCKRLRDKLEEEGIQVEWLIGEKMLHCWPLFQTYLLPEAKEAVGWIRERLK